MSSKQTCLVVGAGGFLGSHVCRALRDSTQLIAASSNRSLAKKMGWVHLDVTIPHSLDNLPKRVDAIIYLSQSPHYKDFPANAAHIWEVNVQGLLRILEYARGAEATKVVLASSGSVYAASEKDLREDAPLAPGGSGNLYVCSKIAAELLIGAYSTLFSTVCLRLFTLYGPGLRQNMLMARMLHCIREGLPVTLQGEDGFVFNPLYVEDAVKAIECSLHLEGNHTVNVAGPEAHTLGNVCRRMGALLGRKPNFVFEKGCAPRIVADVGAMNRLFKIYGTTLEQGLEIFVRAQE